MNDVEELKSGMDDLKGIRSGGILRTERIRTALLAVAVVTVAYLVVNEHNVRWEEVKIERADFVLDCVAMWPRVVGARGRIGQC